MVNKCSLIASLHKFYCPTHSFKAFGVPIAVSPIGWLKLYPSLSTGSTYHYSGVLLRLSVQWRYPIDSLFSHHMYDTEYSFWISSMSSARTAVDPEFSTPQRSTFLFVIGFRLCLLRLLISLRPDILIFLTGERISMFFRGLFV